MLDKTFAYLVAHEPAGNMADTGLWYEAASEVKLLRSLPEVVILIGSSRFKQAFESCAELMALQGIIVLGKHVFKPGADWPFSERTNDLLHATQFRMIDLASRVHVINQDGYIGHDSYNLVKYAIRNDKTISFMEDMIVPLDVRNRQPIDVATFLDIARRRVAFEDGAKGDN